MPEESVKVEYIPEGWESIWNHIDFYADTEEGKTLCFKMTSPYTCDVTYKDADNNADYAFGTVTIPTHVKWQGEVFAVTGIGMGAFKDCKSLGKIVLPETIEKIGMGAFFNCAYLPSIILPESVKEIGQAAFRDCKMLKSINLPNGLTLLNGLTFYGCRSLESIELPNSLSSISLRVFEGCESLASVKIPKGLTKIGEASFAGCSSLETIDMGDSLEFLSLHYFEGCNALKTIVLPKTVKWISITSESKVDDYVKILFKGTSADWENLMSNSLDANYALLASGYLRIPKPEVEYMEN